MAETARGVARGVRGGAGRTGRHLPGAANGRKLFLKIHVKIQIVIEYVYACNKNKALQLQRGILAFKNNKTAVVNCCHSAFNVT